MTRPIPLAVALLVGTLLSLDANAQVSRREASRLGVDVLTLRAGGDVRGLILKRAPGGGSIEVAVRREWLAQHQPRLLANLAASDVDAEREVYRALIERIDDWLADLDAATQKAPAPATLPKEKPPQPAEEQRKELLRVLQAERATYQGYVDDPLQLPAGEGAPEDRRAAYQTLIRRLDQWIAELEDPRAAAATLGGDDQSQADDRSELIRILKSERAEYEKLVDDPTQAAAGGDSAFVRITLTRTQVRTVFAQPPARRQLALAALRHEIPDVESLPVTELQTRLTDADVDWKSETAEPTKLLDDVEPQDDREWAARRAIYEYQFLKRLDFQGTGNVIVLAGENAPPPDLSELIQGMLDQRTSSALGDLLDEPIFNGLDFGGLGGTKQKDSWMTKATRTAEEAGVHGVRVTRMMPDMQRRQTVVEDRFLAKMPDGSWETIWMVRQTKSARDADPADLDRIKQDPQLKEVLRLVEGLGLGGGGQLDLALQFGAATMNAQQATDDEFYEFRDKYAQQLAGPPLSWK